jgi:hypothetical protein
VGTSMFPRFASRSQRPHHAGRRNDPRAASMGESGASLPFLIIFNPESPVQ